MKRRIWFKAKRYGWGWYPVTWQGWLVIGIYVFVNVYTFLQVDEISLTAADSLINFFLPCVFFLSVLLTICYLTGEKPRWRWGK
jgi:hypothetical protein